MKSPVLPFTSSSGRVQRIPSGRNVHRRLPDLRGGRVLTGGSDDDVLVGQFDLPARDVDVPLLNAVNNGQRCDAELVEPLPGIR